MPDDARGTMIGFVRYGRIPPRCVFILLMTAARERARHSKRGEDCAWEPLAASQGLRWAPLERNRPGMASGIPGCPAQPYAPAASDATQTKRTPRKCMRDIATLIDFLNQNKNSINSTTYRSNFPPGRGATRAPRDGDFHDMTGPSEPVLYKTYAFTLRKGISVLPLTRVTIERICHG